MNMGLESYILSSTLIGVVAQRLVRTICKDCKEEVELTDRIMIRFIESLQMEPPEVVYRGGKGGALSVTTPVIGGAAQRWKRYWSLTGA